MAKVSPFFINIGPGLSMRIGLPVIISWDNSTRPKNPQRGTFGFNTETNHLEYWDGISWYAVSMSE